ncbi:hypothetical protein BGZ74_009044 [Mortierella antarctica]|nr:hypothetical protein BGZ74_009044 [Mortierella antarctica]
MSPTPPSNRRTSHERTGSGSGSQLQRGASSGHAAGAAQKARFGIDMLPLPVIPSPDQTLNKDANHGILPQDVLKTLDPKTVQKAINTSVIASRIYKVLSAEEVENLKKEQDDVQKYIEALQISLTIETRMRDASHSLIRLHESNTNIEAVKASTGQLHATTRKMDQIVQKSQQAMERLLVIQRILLQHEGAVLNAGMRRLDAENRELSRSVLELETIRDQEKEEKLKWKKEHTQLRIQSMIFPNPPGLDELKSVMTKGDSGTHLQVGSEPSSRFPMQHQLIQKQRQQQEQQQKEQQQQQQQQQERLSALENYMKELNEDIHKKDERVQELESQLRLVHAWLEDFSSSAQQHIGPGNDLVLDTPQRKEQEFSLQSKMQRLQLQIENGFRTLERNMHEFRSKAEEAEEAKNAALEFTAMTLANSAQHNTSGRYTQNQGHNGSSGSPNLRRTRSRQFERDRSPSTCRNREPARSRASPSGQRNASNTDLNMLLNDSLLELDLQLSMDHSNNNRHNSHNHNNHQNSSFTSSSSGSSSTAPTVYDQVGANPGRLSRNNSANESKHQRQGLHRSLSRSKLQQQQPISPEEQKDGLVIGDAHEEIKRLNAMVDELERLVRLKMQ